MCQCAFLLNRQRVEQNRLSNKLEIVLYYSEYSRKKRNVLRLSVVKAIDTLSIKKNHVPEDDATSELEKRYLRKRQKRSKRCSKSYCLCICQGKKFQSHKIRKFHESLISWSTIFENQSTSFIISRHLDKNPQNREIFL